MPEWRHFVTQLNQDPGDGSTVDSGLGTIAMEEEDAEADTAGDEEVKGGDREAAIDVALDANATDDLVWNNNDPYFEIDDESSGVHRTPIAALTPLSTLLKKLLSHHLHLQAMGSFAGKSLLWSQNQ